MIIGFIIYGYGESGSNGARNAGVNAGNAPYILFTDDDCRANPQWVGNMVAELAKPDVSAVFGALLPEPKDLPISLACKTSGQRQVYAGNPLNLSFGHSANMGCRRHSFNQIGGFDPMLGARCTIALLART